MSMPTGSKFQNGYATVATSMGGREYRAIAEQMAADGDDISISTARNLVLRAMEKLAREVCVLQGIPAEKLDVESKRISLDPRFQESIASMLGDIYAGAA